MIGKLVCCDCADYVRCGIVDKFEEFVGCVDLVGEIVDFAEVLDVVRQQEATLPWTAAQWTCASPTSG